MILITLFNESIIMVNYQGRRPSCPSTGSREGCPGGNEMAPKGGAVVELTPSGAGGPVFACVG